MWSSFMKKLSNTEAELKKVVYTLSPSLMLMLKNPVFFNAELQLIYKQFLILINFISTFFRN